jgi:4-phospho-D-threonate 3-dehydrogenase / 4-phospho-D-erythronate 3-dehydrogenase
LQWMAIGEELGAQGAIDGLVMAPVNSEAIKLTGQISEVDDLIPKGTFMLRMNGSLRVVPLTEHLRLAEAITRVTPSAVLHVAKLLNQNLIKWGLPRPRIAVAGINPHAMFAEDREKILPAVDQARRAGLDIHGPIPPDSVFRQTMEGKYDAVVTMYHDQGQIAVKTALFEGACSVYLGLPFVMLNVPHGSAYDIAGTGTAQHDSVLAAIKTAANLASGAGLFP